MFRDIGRNQDNLIPPSLLELIPDDDLVFTVIDIVDQVDLTKLYSRYHRLGQHAYHPKMMLALLFYAYTQGIFSSRKIADRARDSIRFLYLTGYQYPDFHTIARFRKNHLDLIHDYFAQIVRLCIHRGLAPLDGIAIDGTKIKANASAERQSKWLLKIAASEDGDDDPPDSSPSGYSDPDCSTLKGIGPGYNAQLAVDTTTQLIVGARVVNARNDSKQLLPMIDEVNHVVGIAKHARQVYADTGYSSADVYAKLAGNPKIDAYVPVHEGTSHPPNHPYSKEQFIVDVDKRTGTCPEGHPLRIHRLHGLNKHGYAVMTFRGTMCPNCQVKQLCTKSQYRYIVVLLDEPYRQAMREKMKTPAGKRAMKIRRSTVEPAFGCIKEAMGFRRFRLRKLKAVTAEWLLIAIAFNLKKIHEIGKSRVNPAISMAKYALILSFLCFRRFIAQLRRLYQQSKHMIVDQTSFCYSNEMVF
jgi:transposase